MKTLLIDANYLCHRAWHSMPDMEYDNMPTDIVFGFLNQIASLAKLFETNQFVFCWDSRDNKRKKLSPTYKIKRNKSKKNETPDEYTERKRIRKQAYKQFAQLRLNILPQIGFCNMHIQKGYEADDLIARLVMYRPGTYLIVSADHDLYQLLTYADMYMPQNKVLVTADMFIKKWELQPVVWASVKAMAGCSSDNITGIDRVGETTAVKYILDKLGKHTKTYKRIEKSTELIDRNLKLVTLPFKGTKLFKVQKDKFSSDNFYAVCERLGLESHMRNILWWEEFFKGEFEC